MEPKIKEAVDKIVKLIEEETDPSKMSQTEVRDFYDGLLDIVEVRYGEVCTDLGNG